MKLFSQSQSFGGWNKRYQHNSACLDCEMIFTIYLPPQAASQPVPVLYWLSGLTCTDENFIQKAGAQRIAAELGMAIVCPDTSPRGVNVPDDDAYDLASGAGFYLNATQAPWNKHYRMYDYIVTELPELIRKNFPVTNRCSISGHSMGGHGALTIALKNPQKYVSVSAFSPICHPVDCPWGEKAFSAYLGNNKKDWANYDASLLIAHAKEKLPLLIEQGSDDDFLQEQLKPEVLQSACDKSNYPVSINMRDGYDHSYFFIASFIETHLRYHHQYLST